MDHPSLARVVFGANSTMTNSTCPPCAAVGVSGEEGENGAVDGKCNAALFFSEYGEGSSHNKYFEVYNAGTCTVQLDEFAFPSVWNQPATPGTFESWNAFQAGATVEPGAVYVVAHPSADQAILAKAHELHSSLSNGNDATCLVRGSRDSFLTLDCIGTFDAGPSEGWDACGTAAATKDHTLTRKPSVVAGNGGNWSMSAGRTATDCEWVVFGPDNWTSLGVHAVSQSDPPAPLSGLEQSLLEASGDFRNCSLELTWPQINAQRRDAYSTGGLGMLMQTDLYEVWLCLRHHPCARPGDSFCFVFNEKTEVFVAWGHRSVLGLRPPPASPP